MESLGDIFQEADVIFVTDWGTVQYQEPSSGISDVAHKIHVEELHRTNSDRSVETYAKNQM